MNTPCNSCERLVEALRKISFMGSFCDGKGDFSEGYVYARRYAVNIAEKALAAHKQKGKQ